MNKESLKEYLSSRYQGWSSFLNNVIFPIFGEDDFEDGFETELLESQPERRQLAEATGIRSIKQVGMMYVGVEPLQIFDVTVSDRVMMEHNRVNIQRLIRAVMDQFSCAFMLFHYEDDTRWDWRFTYCRKSGNKEESTDSKRYTFLLGPGQSCRTATDNFIALYDKRNSLEIKDIENAFNVEALSKEFFGKYKAQYEAFVNYMVDPTNGMRQHFIDTGFDHTGMAADKIRDREEKPIRDYVKKLLGRIVFLHFLQKKGWLGVPASKEWGEGDRDFMLNIFKNANERQKENFLDDILEDLFTEGLDRNRSDQGDLYDTKVEGFRNCRIPYLNGGLFERDILDKKPSHFPASYFNGLLTMLSQYNFTIDENDPNDAEVGVDPEMLGRIFENLLEDNKDKGAFYTPKEIVQYMCRESLIAYLQTDMREEDKECIRQFVTTHDASQLGELKEYIDQKLYDVKICDPAIGSGAFPMGLLRELFFCRSAIEPNIVENAANIKRHIIQNNIYGVDIERGAVDIARLRFWLSLIVDEKSPEALPNLDFKIMQGNSLLEQYKGVDLSTMTEKKIGAGESLTFFDSMLDVYRKNLRDKLTEYYACPEHDKKMQLRKDIADIVKQELVEQGIHIDFEDMDLSANSQFFLWHTWFHDVFSRPSNGGGFDIAIGNPPYISAPTQIASPELNEQRQRIVASKKYKSLNEKWDLYVPFMELGMQLLCPNGVFSMIVPYPLTNQKYGKKLRKMIVEEYRLLEIADLNGTKIFENATVSNCIPFIQNSQPEGELRITQIFEDKTIREVLSKSPKALKLDKKNYVWNLTEEERTGNRFANMNVLGDFCYISVGMVVNANEKDAQGAFKKEDLISDTYDAIHCRKYIEAKDIDKFQVKRVRYLEWNTERCPEKLRRPTFRELYDRPKLIMNCLGTINVTIDAEEHFLHNHSIYCAILWKDLKDVSNKSISSSVKKFSKHNREAMESLSEKVDLYYLLGILNSSMADQLLTDQRGGDYHIYPEHIRNLPIPVPQREIQNAIGEIAKQILLIRETNTDYSELEEQLNNLVEALYQ
ncbi:DNA modification methylase [Bacteroides thetaiotaomicron]|uniref:site-specific DNA-methyltransferase (adenine-specific) n=1 Tax=Bacteroides ovatus TaxID=28116 RepID=A0A6A1XR29_BACOV|nr:MULTISPECIES: Eco57I restriction-modification methylase domain-containing protein [Bacteroidaceae]KAB1325964.1 DNA modification methylase [Bacteroides ovatus]KAB4498307.1 DNA modification methylase [Bacteroides thetaiotaomicron]KAB4518617.1 DNA modification methylase [Bacteroides thetaiotaomicron]KAB4525678.1 DNA modification methylase [Bacteroides thetaiotaomicron]KAB4540941.1 DNA modification methylase [Bacteroides thetaiotaomicron]